MPREAKGLLEIEAPETVSVVKDLSDANASPQPETGSGVFRSGTPARASRNHAGSVKRILSRSAAVVIALGLTGAAAGFVFEKRVTARDAKRFAMPGRLIDVGGFRMHLDCTGTGSPTVILEGGFVNSSIEWKTIQPAIARTTQVCSYDRAGLGWSEPSNTPRTSQNMADELRALLKNAGVAGPYVLVGHSYGGLNVRLYAAEHPEEVAGIVLIDSINPDNALWDSPGTWKESFRMWLYRTTAPIGIPRLLGHCPVGPQSCREYAKTYAAMRDGRMESAAITRSHGGLGSLPLVVIAHDPEFYQRLSPRPEKQKFDREWQREQENLTHLSARSQFLVAKDSGHSIPDLNPPVVIEAVRKMVSSLRKQSSRSAD
jgi:pimeloyl-ACP methyl ester carboxylesterase